MLTTWMTPHGDAGSVATPKKHTVDPTGWELLLTDVIRAAGWNVSQEQASMYDGARIVDIRASRAGVQAIVEVKANGGFYNWYQRAYDHMIIRNLTAELGRGNVEGYLVRVRVSPLGGATITSARRVGIQEMGPDAVRLAELFNRAGGRPRE